MKRLKLSAIVVVVALFAPSTAAFADAPPRATELLREGVALRKAHKDQEALVAFEQSNALAPAPSTRAQIALARAALSDWLAAENDMRGALAATDDPWILRNRIELESTMTMIAAHLGWLEVEVNVAGAETSLDGHPLPEKRSRVVAGHALLRTQAAGYATDTRQVDIPAASVTRVVVPLAELRADPAQSLLTKEPPTSATPPETSRPDRAVPLIVGAVGVVAIGVGAYYGIRAFSDRAESDSACQGSTCTTNGLVADSDGRFAATAADVWIGVGVALVATSVAWLVLMPKHSTPPRALSAGVGRRGPPLFEITRW